MDDDSWQARPPSYRTIAEDSERSNSPSSQFASSPQSVLEPSSTESLFYASPAASSLSLSSFVDASRRLESPVAAAPTRSLFRFPIRLNTAPSTRSVTPSQSMATLRSQPLFRDDVNSEEWGVPRPFLLRKKKSFAPGVALSEPHSQNMTYTFMQTGFNTMSLITSPALLNGSDAQYKMTVNMNFFMPLSHVTQIHRGLQLVAEFEMGIIASPNTLKIHGHSGPISSVLSKSGSRNKGSWFWNPLNVGLKYCLKWDYDKRPCTCYSTTYLDGPILAYFTSPNGLDSTSELAILEVSPAGQEFFDHILTSLMIIERKRLTPDRETALKPLFN